MKKLKLAPRQMQLFLVITVMSYCLTSLWQMTQSDAATRVPTDTLLPKLFLTLVGYWFIFGWGVAMGLHRGISHRRLDSNSLAMWICTYFSTLSVLGRPMDWAIVHRVHHQFSDTHDDPHSPQHAGFWRVFFNLWTLEASQQRHLAKPSLARDLVSSRPIQFFQKHYWITIFMTWTSILAIGGFSTWLYLAAWPAVLSLLNTSIVNAITHRDGEVRDLTSLGLLTLGETYHLAHHREPSRQNYSRPGRLDLTGLALDSGDRLKSALRSFASWRGSLDHVAKPDSSKTTGNKGRSAQPIPHRAHSLSKEVIS